jgi:PII-like signaling protein
MIPTESRMLRIYLTASERWHGAPLYRAVVEQARALHLAGASVFPVELSYGAHRQVHDARSEYSSYDLPVVIEVVDAPEKVTVLAAALDGMIGEGLLVSTRARVVRYAAVAEVDDEEGEAGTPGHARRGGLDEVTGVRGGGDAAMRIEGEAQRVTVYVGSSDTRKGRNLAVAIVERCRALGMAGATVTRGIMGFGKQSVIHKAHVLGLSSDLPEKVEVVDRPEEIARLLPVLEPMVGGGLIVVEDVHVVRYMHEPK